MYMTINCIIGLKINFVYARIVIFQMFFLDNNMT